ncbi:4Fe-4S dicluster domain-containing protein [Gordonibacter massiliensis (ex Traore et al. 2017)]|uniref:4Fe-4S dicluster domain-containing protein n=1 Tax=Gordonibacter massiliensis (ex Traore et al. 2017) TaxID=1841863 RepID=UPI0034A08227
MADKAEDTRAPGDPAGAGCCSPDAAPAAAEDPSTPLRSAQDDNEGASPSDAVTAGAAAIAADASGAPSSAAADAAADAPERPQRIVVLRDFCMRAHGADCERCALACPHGAISFSDDGVPVIDPDACSRCDICLGVCDAFSSTRVTMADLHARIRRIALRGETVVLTCKENVFPGLEPAANVVVLPCLACLSPEFWTLVLAENIDVEIAADLTYCADCERAGDMGELLYSHAVETAEAWSGRPVGFTDVIPEKENLVKDLANPVGVDRRSAFANLVGDVGDIASGKRRLRNSEVLQEFYERRERSRALARLNLGNGTEFNDFVPEGRTKKTMWPKRQMLLEALDRDPGIAERVPLVVSETDCERCTNALACAAVCPTGARRPDPADGTLAYDARYCIGCGLCANACPEGAVDLVEVTAEALLGTGGGEAEA